jgi:hypothetical protein
MDPLGGEVLLGAFELLAERNALLFGDLRLELGEFLFLLSTSKRREKIFNDLDPFADNRDSTRRCMDGTDVLLGMSLGLVVNLVD